MTLRARIKLDESSKIGVYTCMAQGSGANGASATVTMREGGSHHSRPPVPAPAPAPARKCAMQSFRNTWRRVVRIAGYGGSGGHLRIVVPNMAEGDSVQIHCEGAASEDENEIQWYFNNRVSLHHE